MIDKMEMVKNIGLMKLSILDNIKMEKNMEMESLCGLMIVHMKDSFFKIIFMDMENINGKMVDYIKENGKIIKCKEKVHSHGPTEGNM